MSSNRHEYEAKRDVTKRRLEEREELIRGLPCPFCGEKKLYAHTPRAFSGVENAPAWLRHDWWTVGCDGDICDSSWRLETGSYSKLMSMLNHALGLETKKPVDFSMCHGCHGFGEDEEGVCEDCDGFGEVENDTNESS